MLSNKLLKNTYFIIVKLVQCVCEFQIKNCNKNYKTQLFSLHVILM